MKRVLIAILALVMLISLGACGVKSKDQTLVTSEEVNLDLWNEDAESLNNLKVYMSKITDETSASFIPVEDRIAVFDLDGTLYCEKDPYYGIWQTFVHRALNDQTYNAPEDVKQVAEKIEVLTQDSAISDNLEMDEAIAESKAFAGMSVSEYDSYVKSFLQTDATGFNNMKLADAFFKPMLQLIEYLQANDFTIYICSGTDRFWVRAAIDGKINIPKEHVIGMDTTMVASGQEDIEGITYAYQYSDEVIRGDKLIIKNVKMNKVSQIIQEIGRQPVLAFGNSTGDTSMCTYVTDDNPYESMAFMVLCDDTEREYGNTEKAQKMKEICDTNGWETISMKNDWLTIFGQDVIKAN